MSLKCGIVGLPNVGKSTLFNALTKAGIAAENYPFCTIEPNVGIVELPDPRLGAAGRDRQARAHRAGDRRVRRHRRAGGRRVEGRRPGQPVPRPHPRDRRDRQRRALLRRRERDPRRRQGRPDRRHRGDPDRAVPGRPGHRREEPGSATTKVAKSGNDKEAQRLVDVLQKCQAALDEGQAGARHRVQQGRAGGAQAAVPDHREAGDVRRQRRRERLREQPATSTSCARTPKRRRRRWWRSAPRPRPSSPTWTTRTGCCSCAEMGQDRAGPEPADPRRLQAARACRPTSPPA